VRSLHTGEVTGSIPVAPTILVVTMRLVLNRNGDGIQKLVQFLDLKPGKIPIFFRFKPIFLVSLAYLFSAYFAFSALSSSANRQNSDEAFLCQSVKYLDDFVPPEKRDTHSGHDKVWCCLSQAPSSDLAFSADSELIPEQLAYRNAVTLGEPISLPSSFKYSIYFQSRAPPAEFSSFGIYL